jgi:predicted transporter
MLLTTYLEVSGIWVGVLVGCVFFIAVVSSAYLFRKMGKTPDTLGNIMLFLGIFYLASVLLVPAYMQTQSMELASVSGDEVGIMPFFIFAIIILAGFFREYRRHA